MLIIEIVYEWGKKYKRIVMPKMQVIEDFEIASNLRFKKGEIKSFSNGIILKFGDKLKKPTTFKKTKKEK